MKLASVQDEAARIEKELAKAKKAKQEAVKTVGRDKLPQARHELECEPCEVLVELARISFAFADLLRTIIPILKVQPVQQLDTDQVRPRALLQLDLAALMPKGEGPEPESFELDLFDAPAPIKWLPRVVEVKAEAEARHRRCGYDRIGRLLGIGRMTVKRALEYHWLMRQEGLETPYRVLTQKPQRASRWV